MKRLVLFCILLLSSVAALAQGLTCTQSAVITAPVGATTTIVEAGLQIDVCGFVITSDTNNARATFNAGSTAKTGAMVLNAGAPLTSPGSFAFSAPAGSAVTVTAATGTITGLLVYRQSF